MDKSITDKSITGVTSTQRGESLLSNYQYEEAEKEFKIAFAANNNDMDALFGLGACEIHAKKYKSALKKFKTIYKVCNNKIPVYWGLSLCYIKTGALDELKDFWVKFLSDNTICEKLPLNKNKEHITNYEVLNTCTKKLAGDKQYDEAIILEKIATEYDEKNARSYCELAMLYYTKEEYDTSLIYFRKCHDSGYKMTLTTLDYMMMTYFQKDLYNEVVAIALEILERDSDNYSALCAIIESYKMLDKMYLSIPYLQRALKLNLKDDNDLSFHCMLADVYYTLGFYRLATNEYNMALSKSFDGYIMANAAEVSKCIGKQKEAIRRLLRVIKNDNDNYPAYLSLADCYMKLGDKDAAINALEEFQKINADNNFVNTILIDIKENRYNGIARG